MFAYAGVREPFAAAIYTLEQEITEMEGNYQAIRSDTRAAKTAHALCIVLQFAKGRYVLYLTIQMQPWIQPYYDPQHLRLADLESTGRSNVLQLTRLRFSSAAHGRGRGEH